MLQPSVAAKVVARFARCPTTRRAAPQPLVVPLSERELEVLRLLADGRSNREIAAPLFLAEGTVKNHVTNVLAKLGARDRTQAALRARALGSDLRHAVMTPAMTFGTWRGGGPHVRSPTPRPP